jgi:hypothetical protein
MSTGTSARTAACDGAVSPAEELARSAENRQSTIATQPTDEFEPIDLDEYGRLRIQLIVAWERWDEQPANHARVNAHVDAVTAYAGQAAVQFAQFAAAARRQGIDRQTILDEWESDW